MLRRRRPRVAQALVEFALVLPLVVMVSLGMIQVVLFAHARDVLISSVQEGARLAAEDGRRLDEGYARAEALIRAGLGSSVEPVRLGGSLDDELVRVQVDAYLRPIVPLPFARRFAMHADAWVARERFRPGGGGGSVQR